MKSQQRLGQDRSSLEKSFVFEFSTIQQENEDELNYGKQYHAS
jgi:hypothetical protein